MRAKAWIAAGALAAVAVAGTATAAAAGRGADDEYAQRVLGVMWAGFSPSDRDSFCRLYLEDPEAFAARVSSDGVAVLDGAAGEARIDAFMLQRCW